MSLFLRGDRGKGVVFHRCVNLALFITYAQVISVMVLNQLVTWITSCTQGSRVMAARGQFLEYGISAVSVRIMTCAHPAKAREAMLNTK